MRILKIVLSFSITIFCIGSVSAQTLNGDYLMKLNDRRWGPLEARVAATNTGAGIRLAAGDSASSVIGDLPLAGGKTRSFAVGLVSEGGELKGKSTTGGEVSLKSGNDGWKGTLKGGLLNGEFVLAPVAPSNEPLRNYRKVVEGLVRTVELRVYDPVELKNNEWSGLVQNLRRVAKVAQNDIDMVMAFNYSYQSKPFSHLSFSRAQMPAKDLIGYLDQLRVGGKPVDLEFEKETAILGVHTMMGLDTIEQIERAYQEIDRRKPKNLIIDLRKNEGGAFAVKPLVEHVISEPFDVGYFLTNSWYQTKRKGPTMTDLSRINPWQGFSLAAWWNDVQTKPLIKLRFAPAAPGFKGKVYVLTSKKTASAAEMAADALKQSGKAKLVGEKTAGEMLTQSPFDIPEGFQIFLPVGDYFSLKFGRIEGNGVTPDVETDAEDALDQVRFLIQKNR